jgi:hypothetical protein
VEPRALTALHLGTMHPVEQALVLLLAFGPFLVLGLVVRHQRRHDLRHDEPPGPE